MPHNDEYTRRNYLDELFRIMPAIQRKIRNDNIFILIYNMRISGRWEKSEDDDWARESLFKLRFEQKTGRVEKPHRIGEARKEIARLQTVLREKKNAEK